MIFLSVAGFQSQDYGYTWPLYLIILSISLNLLFVQGCREKHDIFIVKRPWSAYRSIDYGYTRMSILNSTHIDFQQVSDDKVKFIHSPISLINSLISLFIVSQGNRESQSRLLPPKTFTAFQSRDFGYTRMSIVNSTHLHMEQVSDDKVLMFILILFRLLTWEARFSFFGPLTSKWPVIFCPNPDKKWYTNVDCAEGHG